MRYLLHDVFTNSVIKYPNNIAIFEENRESVTYLELNKLANKFANYFVQFKEIVRNKPYVGILSSVRINSVAAVLGALKIGCTYIPLDEYSPDERLGKIISNTKLDMLLIDPRWLEEHSSLLDFSEISKVVLLEKPSSTTIDHPKITRLEEVLATSDDEPPKINQVCDDLAYILHSSGSTGEPKGIMLSHRNARTFVDWMQTEFKLTNSDVVMSRAPFKFDLSVFDIFNTLNAGAKIVCFDWNKQRDGDAKHTDYVNLMCQEKATIIYTTPSTFISLLNRGKLAESELYLREVMYAGEPFPVPQLRRLQEALPNTRVANIYGPTETNIITYYWIDKLPTDDSDVPLGYVVEDTEILVVSEDKTRICETDELGELWCRGGTVTSGYLGMEEKTKECQIDSPFHQYPTKFWRTGDYGFLDKNGLLHYRGRRDHMIKVKGFRIEIGEIETALAQNESLDEFVVVAIPDEKYGNRLYCYFSTLKNKEILEDELRKFLAKKLPEYMIPFKFYKKDSLPKTSSGKIDRVLLAQESKLLVQQNLY